MRKECGIDLIYKLGEHQDLLNYVLLLSDIFQNFRKSIHKKCDLDIASSFTAPSLSCMCALKKLEIGLELLTDIGMIHVYENGIRGGITRGIPILLTTIALRYTIFSRKKVRN